MSEANIRRDGRRILVRIRQCRKAKQMFLPTANTHEVWCFGVA
jgi:hypothetical protein